MVLPETARRDPRRGEIPVMRISCPQLSDFPAAGARRKHTAEVITSPPRSDICLVSVYTDREANSFFEQVFSL